MVGYWNSSVSRIRFLKTAEEVDIDITGTGSGKKVFNLPENCCGDSLFKPMSKQDIFMELTEARECHAKGDYQDFVEALNEISRKYGL